MGEIHLPETIIQHIQSLLTAKEVARTTLLSKSWYTAWSTRPNLDFDIRDGNFETALAFLTFVKNTIERYERLNLKVGSFRLWMKDARPENRTIGNRDRFSIPNELISKAMKLGVADLNIEVDPVAYSLDLPQEVLGSENLIRLCAHGGEIRQGGKVSCSKLKSLILNRVRITGPLIWDICSNCPLIEELSFSDCKLILLIPRETWSFRAFPLCPEFGEQNPSYVFHNLKRLFLEKLDFDSSFFDDISSKFPCLKDLTLHDCSGIRSIQISSPSIECITIVDGNTRWANLDVPNIRQFSYSGSKFPCLIFKTAPISTEWKSDITISYCKPVDSWFVKLNKFLRRLGSSKITLSLKFLTRSKDLEFLMRSNHGRQLLPEPVDVQSLPRPSVEHLMLSVYDPSSQLLKGIFWSCRPNIITGCHSLSITEFLWNTFAQERSETCCIKNRNRPYFDDLVEVNAEIFEESVAEWRPIAWETSLDEDGSASFIYLRKIRFQLGWGPEQSAST